MKPKLKDFECDGLAMNGFFYFPNAYFLQREEYQRGLH
jgi:hypothetical protein